MNSAAENGHLEALKFLHSIGVSFDTKALITASSNGHF